MALSGSYNYRETRNSIIDSALRVLGVLRSGDTVNNHVNIESDCANALNLMVKSWQNLGIQLWTRKEQRMQLETDKRKYRLASDAGADLQTNGVPLRIVGVYRDSPNEANSNTHVELFPMPKQEYDQLSTKTSNGTPTQFFFDYNDTQSYITVWPSPYTNINVNITYHKPFDDMDTPTDDVDFPVQWHEAIKWNLVIRLASEFGRPLAPEWIQLAGITLENAQGYGYEDGGVCFYPDEQYTWGR